MILIVVEIINPHKLFKHSKIFPNTERNQTVKYIPIGWHAFDIAPQITTNHDDN